VNAYPEEAALETAVTEAVKTDAPDAIVIGWVVVAAYKLPDRDANDTAHAWFCPDGQPGYATTGLLAEVRDHLRWPGEEEHP
jgi:hypothetical protein